MIMDRLKERSLRNMAYRYVTFYEKCDPYEFRDNLESWETIDDGIERMSEYVFGQMSDGEYGKLIDMLDDLDFEGLPDMVVERQEIIDGLRKLWVSNQEDNSKTAFKQRRKK